MLTSDEEAAAVIGHATEKPLTERVAAGRLGLKVAT